MKNIYDSGIYLIERNIRGAWVIYGSIGIRQYYDYTKKEAKQKYLDEIKEKCKGIRNERGQKCLNKEI